MIGPELILPSEWLPVTWGGDEPEFGTEAEMRTVLGTIMGRYNQIIAALDRDPIELDPIFWESQESEIVASDWVAGFLDAVALRSKAWEPLIEDEQAGIMMLPILLLNGDAELNVGPDDVVDKEAFLAEVPDVVPACVVGIHEFWRDRAARHKPRSSRRQSSSRNRTLH